MESREAFLIHRRAAKDDNRNALAAGRQRQVKGKGGGSQGTRRRAGVTFSSEGFEEIREMMDRLAWNLQAASTVFMTEDAETAKKLADEKARFRSMENSATDAHLARLRAGKRETQATTSMHLDLIRDLKLVNAYLVAAAAYPILEGRGKLLSSRVADS
jgi:phosphate:Na+ symporter